MDWSKSQLQVTFKQLRHFLPYDEEVEYAVVARNHPNSLYIRPALLATDRRIIFLEPKYLGLSSIPREYNYSDFADIHLDKGFFTHKLSLTPYPGLGLSALVIDHLEKRRSEAFYLYVQGRIGRQGSEDFVAPPVFDPVGYAPNSAPTPPPAASTRDEDSPLFKKLKQLKQLHDEGLLSDEEYQRMKAKELENL